MNKVGELGSLLGKWFGVFWTVSVRSSSGILSKGMPSSARIAVVEKRAAWRIGESNARRARVEEYEDSILWVEEINSSLV